MGDKHLLIVGASARAAAQSAAAAGFQVSAIDMFADADLQASAKHVLQSRHYPTDILALERELPPGDWLYTGGLENHPGLVERLSERRRLLGCDATVLRRVRDRETLAGFAHRAEIRFPESCDSTAPPAEKDRRLLKRRRSAAGLGIVPWTEARKVATGGSLPRGCYLQHRVEGMPLGASFLADGQTARFLGAAEQLLAPAVDGSAPFRYGGSITVPDLEAGLRNELTRIGELLAGIFRLVGLFGIDVVVDPAGNPWLLEVNPRPTASMELLERAMGISLIGLHVETCRTLQVSEIVEPKISRTFYGKKIVYAPCDGVVSESFSGVLLENARMGEFPWAGDIPAPGSPVKFDQPLVTLFADSASREESLAQLSKDEEPFIDWFRADCTSTS